VHRVVPGLKRNVVDIVLPRLLLGDRLARRDIAALGLGGFLTAAERAGILEEHDEGPSSKD
jgi:hypothetical protein